MNAAGFLQNYVEAVVKSFIAVTPTMNVGAKLGTSRFRVAANLHPSFRGTRHCDLHVHLFFCLSSGDTPRQRRASNAAASLTIDTSAAPIAPTIGGSKTSVQQSPRGAGRRHSMTPNSASRRKLGSAEGIKPVSSTSSAAVGTTSAAAGSATSGAESDRIKVVVRMRPVVRANVANEDAAAAMGAGAGAVCAKAENKHVLVMDPLSEFRNPQNVFMFDRIFDHQSTQEDVFEECGRPAVENVLNGYATLFFFPWVDCQRGLEPHSRFCFSLAFHQHSGSMRA